jgi:hypothetical protein
MIFVLTPPTYTQVQTGNANAGSSVQTDIQGNGSVSTHIEVQANGEKKTLDANSPGTYSLSVQSNDNGNPTTTPTPTIIIEPSSSPKSATATPTIIVKSSQKQAPDNSPSFFVNLAKYLESFFRKIFKLS